MTEKKIKNIVIFSGTSEGRRLSERLAELNKPEMKITVHVATEYGAEEQGENDGIDVEVGRKTKEEIGKIAESADIVTDATHPYAVAVTRNIIEACRERGTEYIRLKREESPDYDDIISFPSTAEAAEYLKETEGNILLTTGAKELGVFSEIEKSRLFPRVLPVISSLEATASIGIPSRNVIAMQGPFSEEVNLAMMKMLDVKYMVTKDGGAAGGYPEKIEAARKLGVKTVLIKRPEENGMSIDEVFDYIRENSV